MRNNYFKEHKITYLKRINQQLPLGEFIVIIDNVGYWLNEIIMLNLEKDYEIIREIIFGEGKEKIKWTDINNELIPLVKSVKNKSEIEKVINLPKKKV